MEKISVIMPVYNTEKYLKDSINSVLNQTYSNIELLCINDGSTDNSLEILSSFSKKDSRVVVASQENMGTSITRNKALDKITGDYIAFLDSDDIYHPQYLEILYNSLKKYDADLSVCKYVDFTSASYSFSNTFNIKKIKPKSILNNPFFDKFVLKKKVGMYMWLKLAKRDLYSNIRFDLKLPDLNDTLFLWEVLYKSRKCISLNEKLIAYRLRDNSISHQRKFTLERFVQYCNSIIEYNNFLKNNKLNFLEKIAIKRIIAKNVYYIYYVLTKNSEIYKENNSEVEDHLMELWRNGFCHFHYLNILKFFKIHAEFKKILNKLK